MLLDNPKLLHSAILIQDNDILKSFHEELSFIIKKSRYETFYSTYVPEVPNALWISFSFYKGEAYVTVCYKGGSIYTNIITEDLSSYVFTVCMLDLGTLTPVDKEDSIKRIAKEKSR